MAAVVERDTKVTVERELVSQVEEVEEEDMEALLGTYVLYLKLSILPSTELFKLVTTTVAMQCLVSQSVLGENPFLTRYDL